MVIIILCGFVTTSNPFHIKVVLWLTFNLEISLIAALKHHVSSYYNEVYEMIFIKEQQLLPLLSLLLVTKNFN